MYSLDVFLVGAIQDSKQVALYRSASIIPIALFFIPNSYISAHYAYLAKTASIRISNPICEGLPCFVFDIGFFFRGLLYSCLIISFNFIWTAISRSSFI